MALPAILSCCSWSNVQIMVIVLLFGNELSVPPTTVWGKNLVSDSRLPGGTLDDELGENLETATRCPKNCRFDCLRLSAS